MPPGHWPPRVSQEKPWYNFNVLISSAVIGNSFSLEEEGVLTRPQDNNETKQEISNKKLNSFNIPPEHTAL